MPRNPLRFGRRLRRWFYTVFAVLFLSGVIWLALSLTQAASESDSEVRAAQPALMKIHGAAAMASIFLLGVILPLHIRRGWKSGRNRTTGSVMIGLCAVLILSGYALYYAGGEQARHASALLHDGLGLLLPTTLLWHIIVGRRARRVVH
ncbi:MAG: hypothetical protein ABIV50_01610 [Opitutus sp.]